MAFRRLQLKAYVRSCGRRLTVIQQVDIAKRRERLQGRINVWNTSAEQYLHANDNFSLEDMLDQDHENETEAETENDADLGQDSEADTEHMPDAEAEATDISEARSRRHEGSPENMDLYFPSSFLLRRFPNQGEKELSLRQGQANDALHLLRIALGKKSFLFRSHVRSAKSQQKKTRAWAEVAAVDGNVRQLSRVYVATRRRMITLGADAVVLDRYKVLRHSDLKISTAIATPNARGQRNVHMAWFWTMDMSADTDTAGWMEECRRNTLKYRRRILICLLQFTGFIGFAQKCCMTEHTRRLQSLTMKWAGQHLISSSNKAAGTTGQCK